MWGKIKQKIYFLFFKNPKRTYFYSVFIATLFLGAASGAFFNALIFPMKVKELESYTPPMPTKIYDVKGRLIYEFYQENREYTPYEDIPVNLIKATLATEDDHFFKHYGFSPWRILMAIFIDVVHFQKLQGASTITLQLSKVLFLSPEKKIMRKIKELLYGLQIERMYSKKEILSFYFNQINYGKDTFGIGASAKVLFHKNIADVNLGEAALLAGLPKAPNYYAPSRNPKNAYYRQRTVLLSMVKKRDVPASLVEPTLDKFWSDYGSSITKPRAAASFDSSQVAPHFVEYIRRRLERDLGKEALYKGGLKVYTTLNLDHQIAAQKYLKESLENRDEIFAAREKRIDKRLDETVYAPLQTLSTLFNIPDVGLGKVMAKERLRKGLSDDFIKRMKSLALLTGNGVIFSKFNELDLKLQESDSFNKTQGAFVSIEPSTGYITAMVGGSTFNYNNQLNYALQSRRQVGSVIKPFIYAAAVENRLLTASNLFNDVPVSFGTGENAYYPKNYGNVFHGEITTREALAKSINTIAVKVLDMTGVPVAREFLAKIFNVEEGPAMDIKLPNNLTLALGTGSLTPYEVASAYAIFANDGKRITPYATRFITNQVGKVVYNPVNQINSQIAQVIDPGTSFIITNILTSDFKPGGTGYHPDLFQGLKQIVQSGGKTGTSSNWADAWFAGYNKNLVAVVWIGRKGNRSLGLGRTGSNMASPVWLKFMRDVLKNEPLIEFKRPSNVTEKSVSIKTGQLVADGTKGSRKEYFLLGTSPSIFSNNDTQVESISHFIKKAKNRGNASRASLTFLNYINKQVSPTPEPPSDAGAPENTNAQPSPPPQQPLESQSPSSAQTTDEIAAPSAFDNPNDP